MNRLLFLLLLLFCTVAKAQMPQFAIGKATVQIAPTPPASDTGYILIELGYDQSNGVGRLGDDPTHAVTVPPGVYEYNVVTNLLQNLTEPTGQGLSMATGQSLLSSFCKRLKDTIGRKIIVVKRGLGNTGIQDWMSPGYIDSYYRPAHDSVLSYIARNHIVIKYKFFLAYQGENNIIDYDTDQFISDLYKLVNYIKAIDTFHAIANTRIGYDTAFSHNDSTGSRNIMKAQDILGKTSNIPNYILGINTVGTFTAGAGEKGTGTNDVHLTTVGLNKVGYSLADAIIYWIRHNSRITLPTDPEPSFALNGATDTLLRYSTLLTGPWVWEWLFNGTIWETQNDVSTRYRNFAGISASPTFVSNKLSLDTNGYIITGHQFESNTFTCEWKGQLNGSTGVDYFTTFTCPNPILGGNDSRIYYEWKAGTGAYAFLEIKSATAEYRYWTLAIDPTIDHTYKIVNDVIGNTIKLYVDGGSGVAATGGTAMTGVFDFQMLGAGHTTKDLNFRGYIDNFSIKSSL